MLAPDQLLWSVLAPLEASCVMLQARLPLDGRKTALSPMAAVVEVKMLPGRIVAACSVIISSLELAGRVTELSIHSVMPSKSKGWLALIGRIVRSPLKSRKSAKPFTVSISSLETCDTSMVGNVCGWPLSCSSASTFCVLVSMSAVRVASSLACPLFPEMGLAKAMDWQLIVSDSKATEMRSHGRKTFIGRSSMLTGSCFEHITLPPKCALKVEGENLSIFSLSKSKIKKY